MSLRGTKQSRLSTASKQKKERLPRREFCHRERSVAISVVHGWQTVKREIASQARNDSKGGEERGDLGCHPFMSSQGTKQSRLLPFLVIARNEAISPFHSQQTEKREIAALRSQ